MDLPHGRFPLSTSIAVCNQLSAQELQLFRCLLRVQQGTQNSTQVNGMMEVHSQWKTVQDKGLLAKITWIKRKVEWPFLNRRYTSNAILLNTSTTALYVTFFSTLISFKGIRQIWLGTSITTSDFNWNWQVQTATLKFTDTDFYLFLSSCLW